MVKVRVGGECLSVLVLRDRDGYHVTRVVHGQLGNGFGLGEG